MAVSPKVSAATVGAAFTAMIAGIVGPHIFPANTASDVEGLVQAGVTALVTFASGWFARELPKFEPEVKAAETVYTKVRQEVPTVEAVAEALEAPAHVTVPVAQAVAKPIA